MGPEAKPERLDWAAKALYSAPAMPVAMALYAVSVVIPGYLTDVARIAPAVVGAVLVATRVVDVGFDVVVGYLSDLTPRRLGGRRVWIAAGGLMMAAGFLRLTAAQTPIGPLSLFASLLTFYLGWSVLVVPHNAWGSELAAGYHERASIFTWRAAAAYVGSIGFALIPILPLFPAHEYSADVLEFAGRAVAALLALTLPLAIFLVGEPPRGAHRRPDVKSVAAAVRFNRPLQIYMGASVLNGFSNGMFIAVVFIYDTQYLGYAALTWLILLVYIGANLLALPAWAAITRRLGKAKAWALGLGVSAAAYPPMGLLAPGEASFPFVLALFAVAGAAFSVSNVATPAILGDVADYETFRSGARIPGSLFALQALIDKFNQAVGAGAAFLLIGAFGYAGGVALSPQAVLGLKLAHLYLPALINVAAILLILRLPLNARAQAVIARWIARRRPDAAPAAGVGP